MIAILFLVLVVAAVSVTAAHRAAERARCSGRMADGRFLLAFSGLLAKMAMADGTVSAESSIGIILSDNLRSSHNTRRYRSHM